MLKSEDITHADIRNMQSIASICYNTHLTELRNERLLNVVNTLMVIQEAIDNFDV